MVASLSEAAGDAAPLLELGAAAFDDVAVAVGALVEAVGSAAGAAPSRAVVLLVVALGDRHRDAAAAEHATVGLEVVALVREQPGRPGAWSSGALPRHPDLRQQGPEQLGVVGVPAGQQHCQRPALAVARQMNLARQAAPGPPDRIINRL